MPQLNGWSHKHIPGGPTNEIARCLLECHVMEPGGVLIGGDQMGQAMKEASVAKPATCNICDASFPSRSKMFKHIKAEHPDAIAAQP